MSTDKSPLIRLKLTVAQVLFAVAMRKLWDLVGLCGRHVCFLMDFGHLPQQVGLLRHKLHAGHNLPQLHSHEL